MPATTTKFLAFLGLLIVFAAIAFGGGYLIFDRSGYDPPATAEADFSLSGAAGHPE